MTATNAPAGEGGRSEQFRGARFEAADLRGARFTDYDLTGVTIRDGWLVNVTISGLPQQRHGQRR